MLHVSVITSLQADTYIDELVEIFLSLSMKNITSAFNYCDDLSNVSVYVPSTNDKMEDFNEYSDHLWALYDAPSTDVYVIV